MSNVDVVVWAFRFKENPMNQIAAHSTHFDEIIQYNIPVQTL